MIKVCIIGLGTFGKSLALALSDMGAEVMAIDRTESIVNSVKDRLSYVAIANSTDPEALKSLPLKDMDAVVVSIGDDFEGCLLTTAHLREQGFRNVHVRAESPVQERILRSMGVRETFSPESLAANRLAKTLFLRGVRDSFELAPGYSIVEIGVPKKFVGKTLIESELRGRYNMLLVSVKKFESKEGEEKPQSDGPVEPGAEEEEVNIVGVVDPDYVFSEEDVLVLFGSEENIQRFLDLKRARPDDEKESTEEVGN